MAGGQNGKYLLFTHLEGGVDWLPVSATIETGTVHQFVWIRTKADVGISDGILLRAL